MRDFVIAFLGGMSAESLLTELPDHFWEPQVRVVVYVALLVLFVRAVRRENAGDASARKEQS